ncbi:D-TA family PLP-dependent enzyme [Heliobacillus mobilis]|uniref:D-TA family PLP-dependent enzyme n=1 Tax=Heliobacterium mobile TaxID=28064 RepID=A0A6I3SNW3_HELMO|nr:alanine racemase [Heliobacterium mobile]MTV50589.1 D-TA family PLP-dependent enzyme [Heliobacterium mobile]
MGIYTTPYVAVSRTRLIENIRRMAGECNQRKIKLRPHFKTHKMIPIAQMQAEWGTVGFTVAKLTEAQVLIKAGFKDILIAYPLWGEDKWNTYWSLSKQAKLSTIIDSTESLQAWSEQAKQKGQPIRAYVKVDSGLGRVGYPPGERLNELVRRVAASEEIEFLGLLTHAGHAYGANSPSAREQIGREEGRILMQIAESMKAGGIEIPEISTGSTPTVEFNLQTPGVTEIRPGNYVFNDATQVRLGVVPKERCALTVVTTVVSRPNENRCIIDAGAKVLALDQGAHGNHADIGYGIPSIAGWKLSRLSEEHGVLERVDSTAPSIPVGAQMTIIPNHACPVINLADQVVLVDDQGTPKDVWYVDARGCSQ